MRKMPSEGTIGIPYRNTYRNSSMGIPIGIAGIFEENAQSRNPRNTYRNTYRNISVRIPLGIASNFKENAQPGNQRKTYRNTFQE